MIQGSLDKPYSVMDGALNPENKNHWLKKDFIDVIEEKGLDVYVQHYTIFDNPFLSKDFVENLCKEYEGTVYYNRLILGQWCDAEGIIFKPIAENKEKYLTDKVKSGIISIGIDWGGHKSNHTICATKISRDFSYIQTLKSDILNAEGTDTKVIFKWIIEFVKEIQLKYGGVEAIFPDCAEQVLNNSLRKELALNSIFIPVLDSVKTPIEDRIRLFSIMLNINTVSFIKDETDTVIEALQTAVFDETAPTERWIDDGETSDIDSIDAFFYSFTNWQDQLARYLGG